MKLVERKFLDLAAVFTIGWNTRRIVRSPLLLILATGFLATGLFLGCLAVHAATTVPIEQTELMDAAHKANLGSDLVVQTPYGDSGRTTFFIKSEADYKKYAKDMKNEALKIMKRINHMPGTMEVCVTRHGTLSGPIQTDITGYAEITPYKGGWCGNDV